MSAAPTAPASAMMSAASSIASSASSAAKKATVDKATAAARKRAEAAAKKIADMKAKAFAYLEKKAEGKAGKGRPPTIEPEWEEEWNAIRSGCPKPETIKLPATLMAKLTESPVSRVKAAAAAEPGEQATAALAPHPSVLIAETPVVRQLSASLVAENERLKAKVAELEAKFAKMKALLTA